MKPLAITLGDPAGIGAEVVFRSLASIESDRPLWLFGDWNYAKQTVGRTGVAASLDRVMDLQAARCLGARRLFVDVGDFSEDELQFGRVDARYGAVALRSIEVALAAIDEGLCEGLVTAPIHKQAIKEAGSPFTGHTELLAHHFGLEKYGHDFAMYFDSPSLRVSLMSVHVSMTEAILRITKENLVALALLTHQEYGNFYGTKPRIGVAGLNPHAGEGGMFGEEEIVLRDGVVMAEEHGLSISGPHPPDTIFRDAITGKYDVVIAMYHDQGLIPIKTIHFEESVNVTLGLPYLRASVDHGTAFAIAGQGIANPKPMRYAIQWAIDHV